jgi:phospholipase/carboxylesterase
VPIGNEILAIESDGWILRVKPPQNPENAGVLMLLHGWTGDETVMWIFARNLDQNTWIVAPRGPVSAQGGGYGWLPHRSGGTWHSMADFQQVTGQVMDAYPGWLAQAGVPPETAGKPFNLMGFSQGAAMSFALAAHYPERVKHVAALAGFLPEPGGKADLTILAGKKIYIAHGTQDDTVPVTMAQEAVRNLQAVGAQVIYCESESGHKLSLDCLRGLQAFLTSS